MQYLAPGLVGNYTCSQCGQCCYGWKIEITPTEFKDIIQAMKPIPPEQQPQGYGFDIQKDKEGKIISGSFKMTENNHCGFLTDHLCFIHSQFGTTLKPIVCVSYPFYAIRTPQNTYINVSFSCMAATKYLVLNNPCQSIWPSPNLGTRFSTKMDLEDRSFVHLAEDKSLSWPCFYILQEYMTTQVVNPLHFLVAFWHCIRGCSEQNFTQEQMASILAEPITMNIPVIDMNTGVAHLKNLFSFIALWAEKCQCDHGLLFVVGLLKKRLGYHHEVTQEFALAYTQALLAQGLFQPNLRQIILNYVHTKLWICDYYFSRNILDGMSIIAEAVGLTILIALANTPENTTITEECLCQSIATVERYFFHSDIFSYQNTLNIDPAIGFGAVFAQWPHHGVLLVG